MKPHSYFVIIPTAGIGTRLSAEIPKQYLPILGKPIIEHTLNCFINYAAIEKIMVVLRQDDQHWPHLKLAQHSKIITTLGGAERFHSVLNGLTALEQYAQPLDWVLIHDAVRPCLQPQDIAQLITTLSDHPVGGLLGSPVTNTLKRIGQNNEIIATVDRQELWQAFSPQMFRFGVLKKALQSIIANNQVVTDDAAAVELAGYKPIMVQGRTDNIKITQPLDLALAEFYLSHAT